MQAQADKDRAGLTRLARRHWQFAWWSLLCFLSLGIMLETLHGFKIGWYLDASHETRRLMWTLGHAHGTLLSLVHAAFAAGVMLTGRQISAAYRWASPCLMGASLLLPGGFFLAGIYTYGGDPGIAILLVPFGAMLLWVGVLLTALTVTRSRTDDS